MKVVAPQITQLPFAISNAYLVGERGGPWVVVDTGTPGHFEKIRAAAQETFGREARPDAIILTHGHFDHAGSALELASFWDVPIFAHHREMPFLTGRDKLPPLDPTAPGFFAFASRFLPQSGYDFGAQVRVLPSDGTVPGMPGWAWHHTPGHTPGHVSLFRAADRMLLAGDAFVTMDLDSFAGFASKAPILSRSPTPAVSDWTAARRSTEQLADLRPYTVAAGHGVAMSGPDLAGALRAFAEDFSAPAHGRYVPEPARADENGIVSLPPPPPDPLPKVAVCLGVTALVAAVGLYFAAVRRKNNTS